MPRLLPPRRQNRPGDRRRPGHRRGDLPTPRRRAGAKSASTTARPPRPSRVAHEIGGLALAGDVTSEIDVDSALDEIVEHFGPVDLLVNSAGITGKACKLWEMDLDNWRQVLDVNVMGTVIPCKAVVGSMRERRSMAGSSTSPQLQAKKATRRWARIPQARRPSSASTKSLAKELVQQGDITVNLDRPRRHPDADPRYDAADDDRLTCSRRSRAAEPGTLAEVAALSVHFLEPAAESSFTTGQCYATSAAAGRRIDSSCSLSPASGERAGSEGRGPSRRRVLFFKSSGSRVCNAK